MEAIAWLILGWLFSQSRKSKGTGAPAPAPGPQFPGPAPVPIPVPRQPTNPANPIPVPQPPFPVVPPGPAPAPGIDDLRKQKFPQSPLPLGAKVYSPLNSQVVARAKALLPTLPMGLLVREHDPVPLMLPGLPPTDVVYRAEDHGGGKKGITVYRVP